MNNFITDPNSTEAQQLLLEPVIAWDIESDARAWHWKKTHKRGVSYCADMTEIAFYAGPHLPTLVLSASPRPAQFVFEAFARGEDGLPLFDEKAVEMEAFEFSEEQLAFITAMFNREDPVTFIAHNLVFDARQVFGKLGFEVRDNFTLWDTRSIHLLHTGWMPDGWEDEDEDFDEEADEDDEENDFVASDKNDLLAVYERMVGRIDPLYKSFLTYMKGERPNFPVLNMEKLFASPDVLRYLINKELIRIENQQALAQYLAYQYNEKKDFPTLKSVDPDVYQQALSLLIDLVEVQVDPGQTKNALRKAWKEAYNELSMELDALSHRLVEHYITFDVIAAYEIYEAQQVLPQKYPKYPKLLVEDLEYIKWCAEVAAKGVRVDRGYVKQKLVDLHQAYKEELAKMGLGVSDWDRAKKTDFALQYIFWGNQIDDLFKEGKNYAKNVKAHIAKLEAAGEKPSVDFPSQDTIKAWRFNILTTRGKQKMESYLKTIRNGKSASFPITTTEYFSFGKNACAVWTEHIYPDKTLVTNIARLKKLQGAITYLEMLLRETECDGRAHTLLGRFAVTGRSTSGSPNLQNTHFDTDGKDPVTDMAGVFLGEEGFQLIEADYSNAENYSAAMYSGDPALALACVSADFHSTRAALLFPEAWAKADKNGRKKLRSDSKKLTFGTGYGMGVEKLSMELGISKEEAQVNFLDRDAAMYPYLAQAKDDAKNFSNANGYINTWSGRRMRIGKAWNEKSGQYEYKGYSGWNSINQGGVGDVVVIAINRIRKYLRECGYKTYIASQVHDSLVVAVHLDEYPQVVQEIIEVMSTVLDDEERTQWSKQKGVPVYWNDSTTPAVRWLTELDNMGNAKKWGKVNGQDYPFSLTEYVNRWGIHQMTEAEIKDGKAPTWINQCGYGEKALAWEMGVESFEGEGETHLIPRSTDTFIPAASDFNWALLQMALRDVVAVAAPMQYGEKIFEFPEAMAVREQLFQRGQDNGLKEVLNKFDKLADEMRKYESWKQL